MLLDQPDDIQREGQHYLEHVTEFDRHHSVHDVFASLNAFPRVLGWLLAPATDRPNWRLPVETVERFQGDVPQLRSVLDGVDSGQEIHVVSQTEAEAERLAEIFAETRLAREGKLHFPLGHLHAGFGLPQLATSVLSGAEMFGRTDVQRATRKRSGKAIDRLS